MYFIVEVVEQKARHCIKVPSPLQMERSPDSYRERGEVLPTKHPCPDSSGTTQDLLFFFIGLKRKEERYGQRGRTLMDLLFLDKLSCYKIICMISNSYKIGSRQKFSRIYFKSLIAAMKVLSLHNNFYTIDIADSY